MEDLSLCVDPHSTSEFTRLDSHAVGYSNCVSRVRGTDRKYVTPCKKSGFGVTNAVPILGDAFLLDGGQDNTERRSSHGDQKLSQVVLPGKDLNRWLSTSPWWR